MYKPIRKGDLVVILEEGDWYNSVGVCTEVNSEYAYIFTIRFPEYLFKVDITNRSRIKFFDEWAASKTVMSCA